MKPKKIPMRKCVVTNERFPKQELIRVVKDKEGNINVDLTGKLNGRGAYVKRDSKVIQKAMKTRKLDRHLDVVIPEEIYVELLRIVNE